MKASNLLLATATTLLCAGQASAERYLVKNPAEYEQAAESLEAGDEIVLADGEWRDFEILFEGQGTAGKPITLSAETKGKVVLTGQSNLSLSGEYLVVSGLVFRSGHAPGEEVISFRRDSKHFANHSRVTEVVIDRFNKPDRRAEDIWVAIYGSDNRVDHSHFEGKMNAGVTLAVIRPRGRPEPNRHHIDHNYFGPRPNLGSNGGETIRIGTSEESLSDSNTIVENNYFEHCDGEVEIVSNKSGGNIIRNNVFFESAGALVLRHGGGNFVEGNVFFGNGKADTGGIRVINPRQTVRGNYMEGLTGTGFVSAITVMNGVPNSVINRYHQVVGALIERNTIVNARRITLGAGADAERSAPPRDSRFERNLIVNASDDGPFRAEADLGGIAFAGNVQTPVEEPVLTAGFTRRPVEMARAANGLLYPSDPKLADVGAPRDLNPISRAETGVAWYPKDGGGQAAFGSGQVEALSPGTGLGEAVSSAGSGDTIRLAPGTYAAASPIVIDRTVTIRGPGHDRATIAFSAPTLFQLENGGRLRIEDVTVTGAEAPRAQGNAVIRTSARPMTRNYAVEISGARFTDMKSAPAFDVIATTPSTLADRILIEQSSFDGVSGAVVAAHSETGEKGWYNAEQVEITGSAFYDVGQVVDLHRGGRDESTFGPRLLLARSSIVASGAERPAISLSGVQQARITSNAFAASGPIEIIHSVGTPVTLIADNIFTGTPSPVLKELYAEGPHRAVLTGNVEWNVQ